MFSFKKTTRPCDRGFYAWNKLRAGDFLIYVCSKETYYEFLYIPGGDWFRLTEKDFSKLVNTKQLTLVEQLPTHIFQETVNWAQQNVALSSDYRETNNDENNTK